MENQFKLRISRMFKSSFGSCKPKNITDVIERPPLLSENENQTPQSHRRRHHHHQLIELFSPKPCPFPSMCKPRWPETFQTEQGCIVNKKSFPRCKVTERRSFFLAADFKEVQKCPPASPASPFKFQYLTHELQDSEQSKPKMKRNEEARVRARSRSIHEFPACSYNGLFSSDDETQQDEDDKTTLFSSRSLSTDSSESFRKSKACKGNKTAKHYNHRRRAARNVFETGPMPLEAKVKDSFAVVKRSRDPYNDFRTSMVEMIIEKQMLSGKDLQTLLQCFLSLNSHHHHKVIIQVFTEIWEALFSNWS